METNDRIRGRRGGAAHAVPQRCKDAKTHIGHERRQAHSMAFESAANPSQSAPDGHLWEVQEIIAERTTGSGENEFLVVWKTSWIPKRDMMPYGHLSHVMRRWNKTTKWSSCDRCWNADMQVILPVESGTAMAADIARSTARRDRYNQAVKEAAARTASSDGCGKRCKPNTES